MRYGPRVRNVQGFPKAGDIVTFGHYEQDGDPANGPEPIEWIVLDTEDGYTTLLSRYGLETKPYCETGSAQWKTCSLRKWLNDSFLNEAFTDEEQKKIETSAVSEKGVTAVSDGMGSTSLDKVYLLSMDEADRYFDSNEERKCVPTQAAVNHGADVRDETCGWWLRTHTNSKRADGTGFGGKLYKSMVEGYADGKVVRPVIRLLTDNIPDEI